VTDPVKILIPLGREVFHMLADGFDMTLQMDRAGHIVPGIQMAS